MPHLSPINWALVPVMFWLSLLIFMSVNWWHTTPNLNLSSSDSKSLSSPVWNWS